VKKPCRTTDKSIRKERVCQKKDALQSKRKSGGKNGLDLVKRKGGGQDVVEYYFKEMKDIRGKKGVVKSPSCP